MARSAVRSTDRGRRYDCSLSLSRRARHPDEQSCGRSPDTAHWLNPAQVSRSCPHPWRPALAPHPDPLLRVLTPRTNSSVARQGCARRQTHPAAGGGPDHGDSRSRRACTIDTSGARHNQPHPAGPPPPTRNAITLSSVRSPRLALKSARSAALGWPEDAHGARTIGRVEQW